MNRIARLSSLTLFALPLLGVSLPSQAATRIGFHGMYCQPRDAATPVVRDPVKGIRNLTADQVTYDCPLPLDTSITPGAITSLRVTYIENSIGNLSCSLSVRGPGGNTIGPGATKVAPAGANPNPLTFTFGKQNYPGDSHAFLTCSVPAANLSTTIPSGIISYSITIN